MEVIKVTPPPKAQTTYEIRVTESEAVLLTLALRFLNDKRSVHSSVYASPADNREFIDFDAVKKAGQELWNQMYKIGDPGLAIQDRLAEFFPQQQLPPDQK